MFHNRLPELHDLELSLANRRELHTFTKTGLLLLEAEFPQAPHETLHNSPVFHIPLKPGRFVLCGVPSSSLQS